MTIRPSCSADARLSTRKNINRGYRALRAWTKAVDLFAAGQITSETFEQIDSLHFEVENLLIALIESLQRKQRAGGWQDSFATPDLSSFSPPKK